MTITDTLENAKLLEKLGLPHEQAQGLAEIVERATQAAQPDLSALVTKEYLRAELEKGLRQQMLGFFIIQSVLLSADFSVFKMMG